MRWIALTTIVLLLLAMSGCTKTIEVPPGQFEQASWIDDATHRIRTTNDKEYMAKRFYVTDSTLVVWELSPAHSTYRVERVPITLPLDEVQSVAQVESNNVVPVLLLTAAFIVGWFVVDAPDG